MTDALETTPFWRRLAARVLDLLFALALTFVLVVPVGLVTFAVSPLFEREPLIQFGVLVCYFLAYVGLEFFLLLRRDGQTLGKGFEMLANIGLLVIIAGLVLSAVPGTRRRAMHDWLSGSRVVRAPRRGLSLRQDARMMLPGRVDMTKRLPWPGSDSRRADAGT